MIHNHEAIAQEINKLDGKTRIYRIEICIHNFNFYFEIIIWKRREGKRLPSNVDLNKRYVNIVGYLLNLPILQSHGTFNFLEKKKFYYSQAFGCIQDVLVKLSFIEYEIKKSMWHLKKLIFQDILLNRYMTDRCIICTEDLGCQYCSLCSKCYCYHCLNMMVKNTEPTQTWCCQRFIYFAE